MRCISSHPLRYDYSGRSFAFTPENIAAAAIDRRDCSCCYAPQVRNEQMTPRGLRLGFCRGRKGYIGNIWLARHNRYQMLLQVRGRLWVKSAVLRIGRSLPVYPGKRTMSDAVGLSQTCHEQSSKTGGQALMKSHLHQRRSGFSSATVCMCALIRG